MHRPRGALRRDLRLSLGDGAGYGVMAGVGEAYLPAFALAVGLPSVLAGLVATVPMLAGGVLQMAAPRLIARTSSLRRWVVACTLVQALAFVPLVVVALTGRGAAPVIFVAASIYWAAGMGMTAGWNSMMCRALPRRLRGRFFGRRQSLQQTMLVTSVLATGFLLHAHADVARDVFAGAFAIAGAARLVSAWCLARLGPDVDARPRGRVRLRSIPPRVRGTVRGALIGYCVAAVSAAALSGSFLTPYLLVEQGLDYAEYTLFLVTVAIAKIIALPRFGRAVGRLGARRLLTACAIAITPLPLLWMVSASLPWLLFVQVLAGVAWAGYDVGVLIALFDVEDENERTTLQVAFSALSAIGTATAALAGGALLGAVGADADGYLWLFLVSTLARLAALTLLVRHLPRLLLRLPQQLVTSAWVLGIRPWGGTVLRPFVEGLGRLRRRDPTDRDD